MDTVQRALAAGIPLVVVPRGRDQSETARRVALCGAGTIVGPCKLTPQRLREAVLEAPNCTAGARKVAAGFAAAGGAHKAAELITGLFAGSPTSSKRYSQGT
jgi:UDP:flavonoid glycosyltransferase YjiC (YdhE family)